MKVERIMDYIAYKELANMRGWSLNKWTGTAPSPRNIILQLSTPYIDPIPSNSPRLNHRRHLYHLANTLKCTVNKKRQNFHVWNSHLQHAARLLQSTLYDRLFLSNSWATCTNLHKLLPTSLATVFCCYNSTFYCAISGCCIQLHI